MSRTRYPELPRSVRDMEEDILRLWNEEETFRESLERTRDGEPFVFYEGPPTANGRPGIHHVFSRAIKDAVVRYRTMDGRFVSRVAGWDTHGLPVEIEAEKRLGISGKPEIEKVGIARFNEVCKESVLTYTEEWERFSARIGYWLDYSDPYVTFEPEYIESVWALLRAIWDRGLLERGHKIVPYCPRCGTTLSSHETSLGYEDVEDPSLYFTVPLLDGTDRHLLVWTTTPWTVVSNTAIAAHATLEYAEVAHAGQRYVLARERVEALFGEKAEIVRVFPGAELHGTAYQRPFDWVDVPAHERSPATWTVLPGDFVSAEDGTGLVHLSPAFGADDYAVGREHGLPVMRPIDDGGRFEADLPLVGGQFVKEADSRLVEDLRARGLLFRIERETHSYPHCWRCRSPLLYMARDSWFIRTTEVKEDLLANNRAVNWHPPEIGTGRFGQWLENNVDWALSRDRYWGTPLPVWECDAECGATVLIGSYQELAERVGGLPDDFDPHRPFIDEYRWQCEQPACTGTMRRTPEVIDVWFDSGSMPFAQLHYPFENRETLERQFPADFICEGVDQTRGWFYSLMAIGTLLGRGPAYRNVIVNGLVLDAEGRKMSKSRGNVVDPWEAIEAHGADAIRWYLLGTSQPWLPKRFDPDAVRDIDRKIFDTVRQTYRFFALYANIEGWRPDDHQRGPDDPSHVLDRWLGSRRASAAARVREAMEAYDLMGAIREITDLVDDLSNWYVRRSRERFWSPATGAAPEAFESLYGALVDVARLMAPFSPFLADWLHRALTGTSVHLAEFPEATTEPDAQLDRGMEAVRVLSTLGRAARETAGVRVRQPLGRLYTIVPADVEFTESLLDQLRQELNVKRIERPDRAEAVVRYVAKPNFRALGARFQKETPRVAEAIRQLSSDDLAERARSGAPGSVEIDGRTMDLEVGDYEILQEAEGDLVMESEGGFTAALDAEITPELAREGMAREVISRVQRLRKESDLDVQDRIALTIAGEDPVAEALEAHVESVKRETLARSLDMVAPGQESGEAEHSAEYDIDSVRVRISLTVLREEVANAG